MLADQISVVSVLSLLRMQWLVCPNLWRFKLVRSSLPLAYVSPKKIEATSGAPPEVLTSLGNRILAQASCRWIQI